MSATFSLRPYQRSAIDSIYAHFERRTDNPLVVIPTGGGKAPTLCTFIKEAIDQWSDTRIVTLVHVRELVQQNFETLLRIWPSAPATVCSASLGRKNLSGQVVVASIQSIYKDAFRLQKVDLIIVDEAHLIPHKDQGMYRQFFADLIMINPHLKIVAFTATPYRLTTGRLDEGEGALFGKVCYEIGINDLIEQGYLTPPITKGMTTKLDISGVHVRAGEFVEAEQAAAIDVDATTQSAVREIIEYGHDRRSWLVFGVNVQHAEHLRDAIRAHGISCESVSKNTAKAERSRIISEFKAGKIKCVTNCGILSTGFDYPALDLVAVVRHMLSPGMWVQIVGRVTRLSPATGKVDGLVLDFGENARRFGPIDKITGRKFAGAGGGAAPFKTCPECSEEMATSVRRCPACGYDFPPPMPKIEATASDAALLSSQVQPEWADVTMTLYHRHEKPGKPPSLRVEYVCGLRRHREWITLEHTGFAREKACKWWVQRSESGDMPPNKVDEALQRQKELRVPKQIMIRQNGKFTEVVGARF